jgi:hypothetical protein
MRAAIGRWQIRYGQLLDAIGVAGEFPGYRFAHPGYGLFYFGLSPLVMLLKKPSAMVAGGDAH